MKTLHLNVHRKWFDMINDGFKKEEYRETTSYWTKRLMECRLKIKEFDTVTFSNGYAKDRDQVVVEFKGIFIGEGIVQWGAECGKLYYIIQLGKIIK